MRRVKFISGLKIEDKMLLNGQELREYRYAGMPNLKAINNDELLAEVSVEERVVPVLELRGMPRFQKGESLFIAYSPDVEALLAMPFSMLQREAVANEQVINRLRGQVEGLHEDVEHLLSDVMQIQAASLWMRLRYLFRPRSTVDMLRA